MLVSKLPIDQTVRRERGGGGIMEPFPFPFVCRTKIVSAAVIV